MSTITKVADFHSTAPQHMDDDYPRLYVNVQGGASGLWFDIDANGAEVSVSLDNEDLAVLRDVIIARLNGQVFDTETPASVNHYIETGRYLTVFETKESNR